MKPSSKGRALRITPIDRRMAAGLVLALVLICFNLWLSYRSVETLIAHNRALTHSYELLAVTRATLAALQDGENSQREFLITGESEYLAPYQQAQAKLKSQLGELRALTGNSRVRSLIPQLEVLIKQRLALGQRGIELRLAGRLEDAREHVRSSQGKQLMARIRHHLDRILAYENSRLNLSERKAEDSALHALMTLILASLATLTLLLLVYRMLVRDIVRRQQSEAVLRASEAELRSSEARKSAILETALDAIISVDAAHKVIEWNPAAQATFGYSRAEALGRWLPELVVPPRERISQLEGISHYLSLLENGTLGQRIEVNAMRRDGSEFQAELAVTRVETPEGPVFTTYLRDITIPKQIEGALHEARDAAEAANRTKSLFLANMSHELRTPLNVILGYAELLEEEAEDDEPGLSQSQRQTRSALVSDLYKIRHAGHHLLTLINQVLDFSKIEAGKMDIYPEDFELGALMLEVSETVKLLMEQNGNTLYTHCQPDLGRMFSDPVKIRQGLLNLLGNAAKFTHGGTVTLEALRETGEEGDWILFCITDTGIGIAPEQMGKLFEPFTQADPSTTRQYGGTGLGLALTRHFCYLLGGSVSVSSVPGEGSSFTMRLPAAWSPQLEPPEQVTGTILDDEPELALPDMGEEPAEPESYAAPSHFDPADYADYAALDEDESEEADPASSAPSEAPQAPESALSSRVSRKG